MHDGPARLFTVCGFESGGVDVGRGVGWCRAGVRRTVDLRAPSSSPMTAPADLVGDLSSVSTMLG